MRRPPLTAAIAALRLYSSAEFAEAASVDVGSLMNVTVNAPLYDPSLTAGGGCDPAGCIGGLTRDGDATTPTSRWSCNTSLGDIGSTCAITYTLANSTTLEAIQIAMYKGDVRIVSVDIFVDDVLHMSWTSSGTATDFERIELSATGKTVELRGVLDESEWLSIKEVEIWVLQEDSTTPSPTAMSTATVAPAPATTSTTESGVEVPTTVEPATAPSSAVAPFATPAPVSTPTPIPAYETVEPTPADRDAGIDVINTNGVPAHFGGDTLAVTIVGTVGLTSLLLVQATK